MPQLTPVWENRFLPLDGIRAKFANEKVPLGAIYIIGERSDDPNAPRVEEVSSREALLDLIKRTYMNAVLDRQRRAEEFDVLGKVVDKYQCDGWLPTKAQKRLAHCAI